MSTVVSFLRAICGNFRKLLHIRPKCWSNTIFSEKSLETAWVLCFQGFLRPFSGVTLTKFWPNSLCFLIKCKIRVFLKKFKNTLDTVISTSNCGKIVYIPRNFVKNLNKGPRLFFSRCTKTSKHLLFLKFAFFGFSQFFPIFWF